MTEPPRSAATPDELAEALAAAATLEGSPVPVDLSAGGVVGIVGDRSAALALARSLLCQAAALHGPADLPVMVLARPGAAAEWDWAKWLPHTRDASGAGRMLSADAELSTRLAEGRLRAAGPRERNDRPPAGGRPLVGPTVLVVVDDESLTEGRRAPTRSLLRGEGGLVAGIVIASTVDRLPAVCTTVVEMVDPDGGAELTLPQAGERVARFLPAGMADDVARDCARALARFEDPELDVVGAGLPASIRLLPLLELDECTPDAVLARWKAAGVDPRPATPVGLSEDGVFGVDFVADGPHALVGGTTGSGKSELLRSMVAGLAASVDPDHLTFVLIDFKGGSAFDECARLPHTVGMVTDLDEHLAERALRCLEAELKHRERTLRDVGATDLPDYLRKGLPEPMPRLLVIIDEFATLRRSCRSSSTPWWASPSGAAAWACTCCWPPSGPRAPSATTSGPTPTCASPCGCRRPTTRRTSSTCPTRPPSPARRRAGRTCGWGPARWWPSRRRCRPARATTRRRRTSTWPRSCTAPSPGCRRRRPAPRAGRPSNRAPPGPSPTPTCRCSCPPSARRSPARAGPCPAARGPSPCLPRSTSTPSSTAPWPRRPAHRVPWPRARFPWPWPTTPRRRPSTRWAGRRRRAT